MKKSYAVVGLGRFGFSVAAALMDAGAQVMALDIDPEKVKRISPMVTCAMTVDVCDTDALKEIGLESVDGLIVSMGSRLEASAMLIISAKEMGVPYILAKSNNDETSKILTKIGADRIVFPEKDAGVSIARKILCRDFLEFFELADNLNVAEIELKPQWVGRTIATLDLRKNYGINIIAVKSGRKIINTITPELVLDKGNRLIITVSNENIKRLM